MGKSIGIDLGTTNSVMAIRVLKSEIIPNCEGKALTPSVVTYSHQSGLFGVNKKVAITVGEKAYDLFLQDPENTVASVKRLMGRSIADKEVELLIRNQAVTYKIVVPTLGTTSGVAIQLANQQEVTPSMVSGEILKKLKADAEAYLNDEVTEAVITVPAYFNEKQKHATYQAAEWAGFKVSRLLSEPSAAAIAYGIDEATTAQTILVYDFGGGTLDISLLSFADGHFMEQAKGGDMWLGGDDIDRELMQLICKKMEEEFQLGTFSAFSETLTQSDRLRLQGEIRRAAECAKIELSSRLETVIEINSAIRTSKGRRLQTDIEITRTEFEELISPLIEKSSHLVTQLLESVHFSPDMIDCVLMVGGSSAIPAFQKSLKRKFSDTQVKIHDRPMHAIAEGAAILAKKMTGSNQAIGELGHVMYRSAHDYYLKLANGEQMLLVEKQTPLPATVSKTLKYEHPAQLIGHFCFSSKVGEKFESIGDLWLNHFPAELGYDPSQQIAEVEFTFTITENDLVNVDVRLKGNSDVFISKTISRGGEDEKLFAELKETIDLINARDVDINLKSNQGFNFLYYSAALAQLITKEISEKLITNGNNANIADSARALAQKLKLAQELCSIDDPEDDDASQWNRLLYLQTISHMNEFFEDKEKLKDYRQAVETVRQNLMQIENVEKLRELFELCDQLIAETAPLAPAVLRYSDKGLDVAPEYHAQVRVGLNDH